MKTFNCCCSPSATLFFESTQCTVCGRMVGFCADRDTMLAFEREDDGAHWRVANEPRLRYQQCFNYSEHQVCNWMVAIDEEQPFCRACRCNDVIPDLSLPENIFYWRKMEEAKRHALYTLLRLRLPFDRPGEAAAQPLLFRFMTDKDARSEFTRPLQGLAPIYTGHRQGAITINLAEADDIARTRARIQFGESYRTLLGHFRHELGHYYWSVLVEPQPRRLQEFRRLFGDERADYTAALQRYYADGIAARAAEGIAAMEAGGAVGDWTNEHVSAYASMHPWEDWAECWAHYMHMIDTLETADAFALSLHAKRVDSGFAASGQRKKLAVGDLLGNWMRLSVALNALNRSMGLEDAYPFVLTDVIRAKLSWIHRIIHAPRRSAGAEPRR